MRGKHVRRGSSGAAGRRTAPPLSLFGAVALLLVGESWFVFLDDATSRLESEKVSGAGPARTLPQLTNHQLQTAADELLASVDPKKTENLYLSHFAREKLLWMVQEHSAGRLEVAFFNDTPTTQLPSDVLLAAWPLNGKATIVISRHGFARFLAEGGAAVAVEHEKPDVLSLEGPIPLAAEIEQLVETLVGIVVVSKRRVKLNLRVNQGFVRLLELSCIVLRALGPVHVVSEQQRKVESKLLPPFHQLRRDLMLLPVTSTGVAEDRKPNRVWLQREIKIAGLTPRSTRR